MCLSISKSIRLISCGLIILGLSVVAFAQFRAGIQGTVTDNNGGIIPDATVTLLNTDTNQSQSTTASESGFYRFSGLGPGKYKITVEKDGFKKKVFDNVTISAEQIQGLDIILDAGVISEVVNVEAGEQPLQTEDANIRKTITSAEITSLPQIGRDPYELARLAPGVFGSGSRGASGNSQSLPNTSGPGGSNHRIFATENVQPISLTDKGFLPTIIKLTEAASIVRPGAVGRLSRRAGKRQRICCHFQHLFGGRWSQ